MFLPEGETFPKCTKCEKKRKGKTFACQLDISKFPITFQQEMGISEGLIQTFFCDDRYDCDFTPFDNARLVTRSELNKVKFSLFGQCAKVIMKSKLSIDCLPKHLQKELNKLHPFTKEPEENREEVEDDSADSDDDEPEVIEPKYISIWDYDSLEMPSPQYEIEDLFPLISERAGIPLDVLEEVECKFKKMVN